MKTNEQTFQDFYKVVYLSNEFNQIELSINQYLFTLENDNETDGCIIFDTFSGEILDQIACLQFDVNLLASEYPNDVILEYIVTNLID
jgi:hypothetical protein